MAYYRRSRGLLGDITDGSSTKKAIYDVVATVAGLAVGTTVNSYLNKTDTNGSTVTGLSGDASKYATPAIICGLGFVGSKLIGNNFAKKACVGLAAAGCASLINQVTQRTIVALSGDDVPAMIPGIGNVNYQNLPDNNALLTKYDPNRQPIGSVGNCSCGNGGRRSRPDSTTTTSTYQSTDEETGVDIDQNVNLNGVEEVCIL